MILFPIVDKTVLDDIFRVTCGAGRESGRHDKTLDDYVFMVTQADAIAHLLIDGKSLLV